MNLKVSGLEKLLSVDIFDTLLFRVVESPCEIFDEVGLSDGSFFGCLVENSRVVSFARPNPDYETTTMLPQSGWREGRRGKLLPGWEAGKFGPLDEEGFIL